MKRSFVNALILSFIALLLSSCPRRKDPVAAPPGAIVRAREYRIVLVFDSLSPKIAELRAGLIERLDSSIAASGARAAYESFETKLDDSAAESIRKRIEESRPDLVFCVNSPSGFADSRIAARLKGPGYRFVSENVVPVETGVIDSWAKPGGNATGVGVFVQLDSALRLLKRVKPEIKRIYSYSWDKMIAVNAWWQAELGKACAAEGYALAEFSLLRSHQAELAWVENHSGIAADAAIMGCISPYVNEDGSLVDFAEAAPVYSDILANRLRIPYIGYEDSTVRIGALMGTCVIWKDLGAQMADLGARVLSGEDPGSIPWQYPRKFNIVINKKTADRLGISIPREILDAAYRIYTDYSGSYMGH